MLHSYTPLVKIVQGVYREQSTTLQNITPKQTGQNPQASPKKRSIMEYMPGLPQDIKSLRICSIMRTKMLLRSHLGIKCHSQYIMGIRLFQYSSTNVNGDDYREALCVTWRQS